MKPNDAPATESSSTMKTPLKSAMVALSVALLAAFTFSGCESTGGVRSPNATHDMGSPKSPTQMSDQDMPGR